MNLVIRNASVVTLNKVIKGDILIEDGIIKKIGKVDCDNCEEINAEGKYALAGFVDMHCHLREPGYEYKEDIASGANSAVHGGFTSICCMPNTSPVLDNSALIDYVVRRGKDVNLAKVYPIGAITKGLKGLELAEIGQMKKAGAIAFSDDGRPVSSGNMMKQALEYASSHDALLITHCEDLDIASEGDVNEGLNCTIAGLRGISRVAEESMVARDILLAESLGERVHIAHVSTRGSVALVRDAKARGVDVTCETCPHYFSANDEEILDYNTNAKINPPLREERDVEEIIEGIMDGTIDAITTDHAPHHVDEKNREFALAPNGTVGFETAFAVAYTFLVKSKMIDIVALSKLMSANPAHILGLNCGKLAEGEVADLVIVDLESKYVFDKNTLVSKSKNSLFDGWTLSGKVEKTIVDGKIVF